MEWSPEQKSTLRKLWLIDGMSATEIAVEMFDDEEQRSAVIGQAARMGLERGEASPPKALNLPEATDDQPGIDITFEPRRVTGPSCCQWPIGDPGSPDFSFCGRPGKPYCTEHRRVAYQPAQKKHGVSEVARSLRRYI